MRYVMLTAYDKLSESSVKAFLSNDQAPRTGQRTVARPQAPRPRRTRHDARTNHPTRRSPPAWGCASSATTRAQAEADAARSCNGRRAEFAGVATGVSFKARLHLGRDDWTKIFAYSPPARTPPHETRLPGLQGPDESGRRCRPRRARERCRPPAAAGAAGKLLIQYVALFRPRTRQLTLDRLATLLGELLVMIEAQRVRFDGQEVAAPQSIWIAALQDMVDRDKSKPFDRPLGNHNYLLQIVCSTSRRLAAVAETRREEQRRQQPEGRRTGQRTARDTALGAVALLRGALTSQPPTEESRDESD